MSTTSKALFSQLESALLRIDELSSKVKRIETETENKYLRIIYEKDLEIARLKAENAELKERVLKLEAEVDRLRKQINKDSGNSSKPPSGDQKPNVNIFNGRERNGKRPGGQRGHKGYCLSKAEIEDKISKGLVGHRVVEHGAPSSKYISKYVIDIKVETIVSEHRFYADGKGRIKVPKTYRGNVQYGTGVKTLVAALAGQGIVASNRIVDLIGAMSENAIRLSDGTVYNFLSEFNEKSVSVIDVIKTRLLNAPLMHVDETGARCESKNMFFRNYSNDKYVLYTFNPTKGKQAIGDDGILGQYIGTLVHDHNTVNYNYGSGNAECNVHLIRYLKANSETARKTWSDDMINLLLSLNRSKKLAMAYGMTGFERQDLERYERLYDEIINEGLLNLNNTTSRIYRDDEKKLLKRLKKYKNNHLMFAHDFNVPFDNNLSERDLRMVKTKAKISGCFRNLSGAKAFANLMSIIKTAIKNCLSPFYAINSILIGQQLFLS